MKKNPTRKERITIRLSPNQMQCLKELTTSLNTSYSLLVRTIISDFLTRNENTLERIITHNHMDDAYTADLEEIF